MTVPGVPAHLTTRATTAGVNLGWLQQLWALLQESPAVACPLLAVLVPQLQEPYKSIAEEIQRVLCPAP